MEIDVLQKELSEIFMEITRSEQTIDTLICEVHPEYRLSAKNLIRYLIVRSYDLRKYHNSLSELGVSSMRTAEGYVYANLYNVIRNINLIRGTPSELNPDLELIGYRRSRKILRKHSRRLFKKSKEDPFTEIMVTLPEEAAENTDWVQKMARSGMQIARINLGRGNPEMWQKMVEMIRQASDLTGKRIKIYMDLPGPKIRTSEIQLASKKGNVKEALRVRKGDQLVLTRSLEPKSDIPSAKEGEHIQRARIGVTLGEIIDDAKIGDAVYFDDGAIKARVIEKGQEELVLEIAQSYKTKIGYQKGINLPHTRLHIPALTDDDKNYLPFVCAHADLVGYSFVRTRYDVRKLYDELAKYDSMDIGVIFKIETRDGFDNLPDIILEGMRRNKIGVMIARGDLAVEVGFEQISEIQNQIVSLCEAAHIPVIWATQVLENLAKKGMPTRAEITDAALAAQAECVMLNKGPHIRQAIKVLRKILKKRRAHSFKKKNELRSLRVAQEFVTKTIRTKTPVPPE